MSTPTEGLPALLRPLPLTRAQVAHYVEELQLPTTERLVCEQFGPLGHMDARLADCVWNVLGLQVDLTSNIPTYPFLRLTFDHASVVQLQVWLWQICLLGAPMWAELRWHPTQGATVNFVNMSADATTRRQQLARLDRALKLTIYNSLRGRTLYSGARGGVSDEELLAQVIEVVRACWTEDHRTQPGQERVLQHLSTRIRERALRRFISEQTGLSWELFTEKYRPR
jgi:hypothetical protein